MEVRACRDADELRAACAVIGHYFGGGDQEWIDRIAALMPVERVHAAFDGGHVVGGAGAFPLELTVPGGRTVAAGGTTVVGVLPTHRRRGVLRALMRAHLDDVRARGEPVAALWASEEPIYGRFGYGLASLAGEIELPRTYSALRDAAVDGTARLVDADEALALFPRVYERVRPATPGMLARSELWWQSRRLGPTPAAPAPPNLVVVERAGEPVGYAIYRVSQSFEAGSSSGSVEVVEALGLDAAATRDVWRILLELDWTARIVVRLLPVDHELFHLLAYPRRMRFRVGDGLWLRLVDVGAALAARGAGDGVVFELADEFCAWNAGRWTSAGERTDAEPNVRLDVQALASVYLGGFTFAELARAGCVEELTPGALRRADALFVSDRKPWTPEIF